mgnify:FL=1
MITVAAMSAAEARELAEKRHYMHRKPVCSFAFGLYRGDQAIGVITFGAPASRHVQLGACPVWPNVVIELNRLWVSDDMPHNAESWFIARALRAMPPRIVVSYADTAAGHYGGVYRAANFKYAGWTDMDRKTPRSDYLPNSGGHTRDAFRHGYTETVRRKPKVRYWTTTGDRAQRRVLAANCGWPDLDWREIPAPTEHRQYLITGEVK